MVECVRTQVNEWHKRSLEMYYSVLSADCVHINQEFIFLQARMESNTAEHVSPIG